jgi:hypothetical protein
LLIDVLVGLPAGRPWRTWVASSEALAAPDCAGVELGRYLRRHTLSGALDANDAQRRFDAFRALGVETYPTDPLRADAFALSMTLTRRARVSVALRARRCRQLRRRIAVKQRHEFLGGRTRRQALHLGAQVVAERLTAQGRACLQHAVQILGHSYAAARP